MSAILGKYLDDITRRNFTDLPEYVDSDKLYISKRRELYDELKTADNEDEDEVNLSCWSCAVISDLVDPSALENYEYFPKLIKDLVHTVEYDDIIWDADFLPEVIGIVSKYSSVPENATWEVVKEIIIKNLDDFSVDFSVDDSDLLEAVMLWS